MTNSNATRQSRVRFRVRGFAVLCTVMAILSNGCVTPAYVHQSETIVTRDYVSWKKSDDAVAGIVRLYGDVSSSAAHDLAAKLHILERDPEIERITLEINSNGGEAGAYRAIVNAMARCGKPIDGVVTGNCYSAACPILQSATGKRVAYANAHFMIHRPMLSPSRRASVDDAMAFESRHYEKALRGKANLPEDWFPLTDEYKFFDAEIALEYGFIDEIIERAADGAAD